MSIDRHYIFCKQIPDKRRRRCHSSVFLRFYFAQGGGRFVLVEPPSVACEATNQRPKTRSGQSRPERVSFSLHRRPIADLRLMVGCRSRSTRRLVKHERVRHLGLFKVRGRFVVMETKGKGKTRRRGGRGGLLLFIFLPRWSNAGGWCSSSEKGCTMTFALLMLFLLLNVCANPTK